MPLTVSLFSYPQPLENSDWNSGYFNRSQFDTCSYVVLPFLECRMRLIQHELTFCVWLLPLTITVFESHPCGRMYPYGFLWINE